MIRAKTEQLSKIDEVMNTAFKDMMLELVVEPNDLLREEIKKCCNLMEYRLGRKFEGVDFKVRYTGEFSFDVTFNSAFAEGDVTHKVLV